MAEQTINCFQFKSTLKAPITTIVVCFVFCLWLLKTVWSQIRLLLKVWVHTVCRYAQNRFEKFARIFSRRHKQTTFSDAVFLGALRVNLLHATHEKKLKFCHCFLEKRLAFTLKDTLSRETILLKNILPTFWKRISSTYKFCWKIMLIWILCSLGTQ